MRAVKREDIKAGTWLTNKAETPRRRMICTQNEGQSFFVVSDTGHMMFGNSGGDELFDFYSKNGWLVQP